LDTDLRVIPLRLVFGIRAMVAKRSPKPQDRVRFLGVPYDDAVLLSPSLQSMRAGRRGGLV
jgi:hypothetical protein